MGTDIFFSGTRMDDAPFSSSYTDSSRIGNFVAAEGNTFDGDVTAGGTYSDIDYIVRIVTGGAWVKQHMSFLMMVAVPGTLRLRLRIRFLPQGPFLCLADLT